MTDVLDKETLIKHTITDIRTVQELLRARTSRRRYFRCTWHHHADKVHGASEAKGDAGKALLLRRYSSTRRNTALDS